MTIPDKPNSRNQQYVVTEAGEALIAQYNARSKP